MRFHYREIDRLRIQIKQGKRPKAPRKNSSTVVNKKPHFKKLMHSAPSENNVSLERVHKVAESITKKISELGEKMSKLDDIQNKHVEQYTCLFPESQYEYGSTKKPFKANSIKGKSTKATKISLLKEATKANTNQSTLRKGKNAAQGQLNKKAKRTEKNQTQKRVKNMFRRKQKTSKTSRIKSL